MSGLQDYFLNYLLYRTIWNYLNSDITVTLFINFSISTVYKDFRCCQQLRLDLGQVYEFQVRIGDRCRIGTWPLRGKSKNSYGLKLGFKVSMVSILVFQVDENPHL